jgi:hypothetical protein
VAVNYSEAEVLRMQARNRALAPVRRLDVGSAPNLTTLEEEPGRFFKHLSALISRKRHCLRTLNAGSWFF